MTLYKTVADANGGTQVAMTADEESAFLSDQQASQTAQETATLIASAQKALDTSDLVAIRCMKAAVAFPVEWQSYVTALRAIVSTGAGTLPTQPAYPTGT